MSSTGESLQSPRSKKRRVENNERMTNDDVFYSDTAYVAQNENDNSIRIDHGECSSAERIEFDVGNNNNSSPSNVDQVGLANKENESLAGTNQSNIYNGMKISKIV